jgi:guanylate kinase
MNPFAIVLSAPSGGGKTTIARMLRARRSDVGYSVSATTRSPREGEVDGKDYHFVSRDEFLRLRTEGAFAESAEVHGNLYGTLRRAVEEVVGTGRHVIMDIDVQGAGQFAVAYPESVLIFLLPPSAGVMLDRLRGRQTEKPRELYTRLLSARDELAAVSDYQYVVVNDDLERAYVQVSAIIDAETVRHRRHPQLDDRIAGLLTELNQLIDQYTD